eukprot:472187-Prymnesium_polylepis.1
MAKSSACTRNIQPKVNMVQMEVIPPTTTMAASTALSWSKLCTRSLSSTSITCRHTVMGIQSRNHAGHCEGPVVVRGLHRGSGEAAHHPPMSRRSERLAKARSSGSSRCLYTPRLYTPKRYARA